MTTILELREKLKGLYANYSTYIEIVLKLVLALICLLWIRSAFNGTGLFNNTYVILVSALLCSVFPLRMTPLISGIFIVGQAFEIGLDAGAVMLIMFLIVMIFFFRFAPDDGLAMILTPIGLSLGIPAFIPLCVGVRRKPVSAVAVVFGSYVYHQILLLSGNRAALSELPLTEFMDRFNLIFINLVENRNMVVGMFAMTAVIVITYGVCRLGFDHAFEVAVGVGAVVYVVFILMGNSVAGSTYSVPVVIGMTLVGALFALAVEFFFLSLNYKGTEKVEFEDDEYYYYVRAVPKMYAYKRRIQIEKEEEAADGESASEEVPDIAHPDVNSVDFERKLEDSLKNL